MVEETKTILSPGTKSSNLLAKSKNCFYNILSYSYSRAEAKILLNSINKRGQKLCNDPELKILAPLTFNIEIRFSH
jgi:hypothetical protein